MTDQILSSRERSMAEILSADAPGHNIFFCSTLAFLDFAGRDT